jgi:RHS repeat-associated protein
VAALTRSCRASDRPCRLRAKLLAATAAVLAVALAASCLAGSPPSSEGGDASSGPTSAAQLRSLDGSRLAVFSGGGGGTTWIQDNIPQGVATLFAVACPGSTECIAVGQDLHGDAGMVIETTNAGETWEELSIPSGTPRLLAVSCSAVSVCVAGGGSAATGTILYQSSVAGAFVAETLPSGVGAIDAVSCPAGTGLCSAVGWDSGSDDYQYVINSTNSGQSWSGPESSVSVSGEAQWSGQSIQCFSDAETCVVAGWGILTGGGANDVFASTQDDWSNASITVPTGSFAEVDAISCVNVSSCVAAGSDGSYVGSATGSQWSPATIPTADGIYGLHCVNASTCVLGGVVPGGGGAAIWTTTNAAATWSSESLASGLGNIDGFACSAIGLCMAVGEDVNNVSFVSIDGGDSLTTPPGGPIAANYRVGGPNPAAPGLCVCGSGEPVDPENGDFYTSATDVLLPTFGPPLAFSRTYDAVAAQSASTAGQMGYGWTDNWASALQLNTPSANDVTVVQADGAQVVFVPPSGGSCPSPYVGPGTTGTYCALPYVLASLTYNSGSSTYSFVTHPQTTDTFNSSGQLTAVTDAEGEQETLAHPSGGSGGCPPAAYSCEVVTSALGRTLTVELTETQPSGSSLYPLYQVTAVTDPMGRTFSYAYCTPTTSGEGTTCLPGDLVSVTDPLGRVTSFTYDSAKPDTSLQHDLLTLTRPNGQLGGPDAGAKLQNSYDSSGRVTSQTDPAGRTTSFDYSGMNETTGTGTVKVTDPDGFTTADNFVSGSLTSSVTDSGGTAPSATDFVRNSSTLLPTATINADGDASVTTYDGDGNITSSTNPLGATSTRALDAADQAACSSTPLASSSSNCPALQQGGSLPAPQAAGGTITPAPSSGSAVPPPYVTYEDYDTHGNLLYQTTGIYSGSTLLGVRTNYDLYSGDSITLNGQLVSCNATPPAPSLPCATIAAPNSSSGSVAPPVTQLAYDSYGDVTSRTVVNANGSQNATTSYLYDADGDVTSTTSPLGNLTGADASLYTTTTTYDQAGEVTATAKGLPGTVLGSLTTTAFDPNGNASQKSNALFETTTTTYDADDEAVLVADPAGDKSLTCYDGDGHVAQTVPPVGVAAGSLSASSCPTTSPWGFGSPLASDATETSYSYGSAGLVVTTDTPAPAGHTGVETTTQYYDLAGQLVETVSPPIGVPSGEATLAIDTYDAAGERTSITTGLEVNTTTGAVGTLAATTTTSYCHDPQGEVTATVPGDGNTATSVSSSGVVTGFVCGPGGATSSAYATTYTFDSAGDVLTTARPVTSSTTATTTDAYYADGSLATSQSPAGMTTTYTYTPAGQVSNESYSDSEHQVALTYDVAGERLSMKDAASVSNSQSSYSYNPAGSLATATNEAGQTTSYGYDLLGDVTAVSYPLPSSATWATNDTVEYGFDQAQHLTSVTDFAGSTTTVANSADGQPSAVTLPTSTAASVKTVYDNTDAPCVIALVPSGVSPTTCSAGVPSGSLLGFSYTYKPNGAVDTETDMPSQSYEPSGYAYNAADRVTSLTPGTGTLQSYTTDASGNLTTLAANTEAVYKYGGELCWSATGNPTGGCGSPPTGATTYSYNANGDRNGESGGTTVTASWNGKDQLTSYSDSAANLSAASYDGDGLRAAETVGGTSQNFAWDEVSGSVPLLLMDGTNAYLYGIGTAPIEQVSLSSGTVSYLVTDALGSVRGVVSSGTLTASTTYDAWGNVEAASSLLAYTPFGFAGGYTDPTGEVYLVNRYYDPLTGQFLSVDPLVAVTEQPYVYTAGNPVNRTDPLGQAVLPCNGSGYCGTRLPSPPTCAQLLAASMQEVHILLDDAEIQVDAAYAAQLQQELQDDEGPSWCRWSPVGCGEVGTVWHYYQKHWRGLVTVVGIVAGIAAALTGVGALADATILGASAGTLGLISSVAGGVSGVADLPACTAGSAPACAGVATGVLAGALGGIGAGVGAFNAALESAGSDISQARLIAAGLFGSQGLAGGVGGLFWDLLNGLNDRLSAGAS